MLNKYPETTMKKIIVATTVFFVFSICTISQEIEKLVLPNLFINLAIPRL